MNLDRLVIPNATLARLSGQASSSLSGAESFIQECLRTILNLVKADQAVVCYFTPETKLSIVYVVSPSDSEAAVDAKMAERIFRQTDVTINNHPLYSRILFCNFESFSVFTIPDQGQSGYHYLKTVLDARSALVCPVVYETRHVVLLFLTSKLTRFTAKHANDAQSVLAGLGIMRYRNIFEVPIIQLANAGAQGLINQEEKHIAIELDKSFSHQSLSASQKKFLKDHFGSSSVPPQVSQYLKNSTVTCITIPRVCMACNGAIIVPSRRHDTECVVIGIASNQLTGTYRINFMPTNVADYAEWAHVLSALSRRELRLLEMGAHLAMRLTAKEVAEIFGAHPRSIEYTIKRKLLPHYLVKVKSLEDLRKVYLEKPLLRMLLRKAKLGPSTP